MATGRTTSLGKDLYVPLIGADAGQTVSYSASSSNGQVVATVLPNSDPIIEIDVSGTTAGGVAFSGSMTFSLFAGIAPDAVKDILGLVNDGLYNKASFYRNGASAPFQFIQGGIEQTPGKTDPNSPSSITNRLQRECLVQQHGAAGHGGHEWGQPRFVGILPHRRIRRFGRRSRCRGTTSTRSSGNCSPARAIL